MTRYTEVEAYTMELIVDLSMSIARKNLNTDDGDDNIILMIYHHWNEVLEMKSDIRELSASTEHAFNQFILNNGLYIRSLNEDLTE